MDNAHRQMTTLIHLKNMIYELMKMMSYLVVAVVVMMMLESIRKHKK
jgi:hypothetical protein